MKKLIAKKIDHVASVAHDPESVDIDSEVENLRKIVLAMKQADPGCLIELTLGGDFQKFL